MKIKLTITVSLLLLCLPVGGCVPAQSFDGQLKPIVKPHTFDMVSWEFETLIDDMKQLVLSKNEQVEDESNKTAEYFSVVERIITLRYETAAVNVGHRQSDPAALEAELKVLEEQRTALEDVVERTIKKQIKEMLAEQGIYNPIDNYTRSKVSFPPLNFKLEKPPCLLVISPRDRIESIREVLIQQDASLEEKEAIEAEVDELGVSSLVVELGGLSGVYPNFVTDEASPRFTIDTATEEWLHQYLFFKPLGFLYFLDAAGVSRNYEIATINETVASMVSKEIGSIVYKKYYSTDESSDNQDQAATSGFDFNREMREIRRTVDIYLAEGEIEQAEEFMELERQYLVSNGYYIRKLNQAYFAFYGTYADSPTSISPIGVELKELRSKSASLKDFLDTVAIMTNRQDLLLALDKSQ
ncbi:hypothetical protein ACFLV3_00205 [Chloroflexota bacterium]